MEILKYDRKILRYIYSQRAVPFSKLKKHFKHDPDIPKIISGMLSEGYATVAAGADNPILGNAIPDSCILTLTGKGAAVVEGNQWFNAQYLITSLIVPVIVGVVSSLITALLLSALG